MSYCFGSEDLLNILMAVWICRSVDLVLIVIVDFTLWNFLVCALQRSGSPGAGGGADARSCIAPCIDQIVMVDDSAVTIDDSAMTVDDSAGLMTHDEREFRLDLEL